MPKPKPFQRVPVYDSSIPWDTSDGLTFLAGFVMPKDLYSSKGDK